MGAVALSQGSYPIELASVVHTRIEKGDTTCTRLKECEKIISQRFEVPDKENKKQGFIGVEMRIWFSLNKGPSIGYEITRLMRTGAKQISYS